MLKAGLLPSPVINALSSSAASSKNQINSQTFVELRTDIPNVRIYFTVDGTKPDPFQVFRTGLVSTYLYRGAFRLGPGRRVVKAIAVTTDGLRESHVTTKYFDVNDMYTEDYSDGYSDNDQSLSRMDKSPERTPPSSTKKKPRMNSDRRSNSANQSRTDLGRNAWDDGITVQGSVEGPISPVNYAGTQINIWGTPGGNLTEGLLHMADPSRNPNFGYMTEQMLDRLPQPRNPALEHPRIVDVTQQEEAFWNRRPTAISAGDGDWKKTLDHIFLNIYNYVQNEPQLQEDLGWRKFGRIEAARLHDKGGNYQILAAFKKPPGEQPMHEEPPPVRKPPAHRRPPKRTLTPPERTVTPPPTPPATPGPSVPSNLPAPSTRSEESAHEDDHTPRIYTEETVQQGTLVPYPEFNADLDCQNLQKAMKGLGTNEEMLVHILGNRSNDQRVQIRDKYKQMFGKDLIKEIEGDTSGNFCKVLTNLLYSPVEYDCRELRRAIKGAGTDEEALIEILASRSKKRIQDINNLYPQLFNRTLEKDVVGDTSSHLKKILVALIQGQRPETNQVNEDEAENDAKTLFEAGEKRWGTDEAKFVDIVLTRSDAQLKAICNAYGNYSKKDIEDAIKSETSGTLCRSLLAIVRVMRDRPRYFAYQLKKALKGMGTDEDELNRVVISRCEVDMIQIKEQYEELMKRSLEDHVSKDTSGDYRRILMELLKDPSKRSSKPGNAKFENVDLPGYEQPAIYVEDVIQQGTMKPASNFDANRDADALRKAMKGLGTDEKTLISILGNRDTAQRLQIKTAFQSKHGRDLIKDLKSETSGNFSKLLERLMMDPVELDCFELKQAMKGLGTDEETLIEILASRSNARLRAVNEKYQQMYSRTLEKDVSSDTSKTFRRLLIALLQGKRPETTEVNVEEAKRDAQSLIDAGQAKFGTDEARFITLFCDRSDPQLRAIFNEFAKLTGKSVEETIKSETGRDAQKTLLAIVRSVRSRPHFFAEQLHKSMKGLGTKESTLNRICITRSEIDLVQIKEAYKNLYNKELEKDVRSETSGDYRSLLLELLKDPSQR